MLVAMSGGALSLIHVIHANMLTFKQSVFICVAPFIKLNDKTTY